MARFPRRLARLIGILGIAACGDSPTSPSLAGGPHPPPPTPTLTVQRLDSTAQSVRFRLLWNSQCPENPCTTFDVLALRGTDTLHSLQNVDSPLDLQIPRLTTSSTVLLRVSATRRGQSSTDQESVTISGTGVIVVPPPPPPDTTTPPPPPPVTGQIAELPRLQVDVTPPDWSGAMIHWVPAGASFQTALNQAERGDIIELQAGATYLGNFTIPAKIGTSGWILVRTRTTLPPPGVRVTPATATQYARIISGTPGAPALRISGAGASQWRFEGVVFGSSTGIFLTYNIVQVGTGAETSVAELPSRIVFDRVVVTAHDNLDTQRCIAVNGTHIAVINSFLQGCHYNGADAQGVAGWNTPGPILIRNSHIEGSGENIMFGGADPRIPGLVPSDITITGNYLVKPLAWRTLGRWTVKNLFELKNARRILVEGNLMENNWLHGQSGFAVVLKTQNQSGACTWCVTEHLTFRYNRIQNSPGGFNLHTNQPQPGLPGGLPMNHLDISNNELVEVGQLETPGDRRCFQFLNGPNLQGMSDVRVSNNTCLSTEYTVAEFDGFGSHTRLQILNNLVHRGTYGWRSSKGEGNPTFAYYMPTSLGNLFQGNVTVGASCGIYPINNTCPATVPLSTTAGVDRAGLTQRLQGVLTPGY